MIIPSRLAGPPSNNNLSSKLKLEAKAIIDSVSDRTKPNITCLGVFDTVGAVYTGKNL